MQSYMMGNIASGSGCQPTYEAAGTYSPPTTPPTDPAYSTVPSIDWVRQLQMRIGVLEKDKAELIGMVKTLNESLVEFRDVVADLKDTKACVSASRNHMATLQGEVSGLNRRRRNRGVLQEMVQSKERANDLERELESVKAENEQLRQTTMNAVQKAATWEKRCAAASQQSTAVNGNLGATQDGNYNPWSITYSVPLDSFEHTQIARHITSHPTGNQNSYQILDQHPDQTPAETIHQHTNQNGDWNIGQNAYQIPTQTIHQHANMNGNPNPGQSTYQTAPQNEGRHDGQYNSQNVCPGTSQQGPYKPLALFTDAELLGEQPVDQIPWDPSLIDPYLQDAEGGFGFF
ncbi:hypothetical protein F4677DRAFT_449046 [Hypoxylon crocopeplum]|nr:hypothetical protein F4677DRAFT_449046 [Hypoxylon crocopeplum]